MAGSCVYIKLFNSQKSFTFKCPQKWNLPKTLFSSLFQQIYGDSVICFEINVYFLASEDDKWVFLTSKNHGKSL